MFKKIPLHVQIVAGLVFGVVYGVAAVHFGWLDFTRDWINPWGTIFIRLLKLIAVPLVLTSLICGVASLSDITKLSRIGGKTLALFTVTTLIAVTIGLTLALAVKPGLAVPQEMRDTLQTTYQAELESSSSAIQSAKETGPLQAVVEIVPDNIFRASADNSAMLQIVFFAILFGIGLIQIESHKSAAVIAVFEGINDVIIRMVDLIMVIAPFGVFALIAKTITAFAEQGMGQVLQLLSALGLYCLVVVIGLCIHGFVIYPAFLKVLSPMRVSTFLRGILPVQLLAFSTSSSGATLPLTMEVAERDLGVSEEVASFVLPLGATVNMDGTALYQGVAAVFIAQTTGMDLTLVQQLTIILTSVLASIGTAPVPGAGIIMLVVILESVGVPSSGIALILGVDRILDMLRTAINVMGDTLVAVIVAASEGQLKSPCSDR